MTTLQSIRTAVVGRRRELGWSQAQVAERVGVSRKWLSEFEGGKATAELGLVLRLLDGLRLVVTIHPVDDTESAGAPATTDAATGSGPIDLDELLDEYRDGR